MTDDGFAVMKPFTLGQREDTNDTPLLLDMIQQY